MIGHPKKVDCAIAALSPMAMLACAWTIAIMAGPSGAHSLMQIPSAQLCPLTGAVVIDGDTLDVDIALPFDVVLRNQRLRCSDFDAWESTRRRRTIEITEAELAKGQRASTELRDMLKSADGLWIRSAWPTERDAYGRILAVVYVDPKDGGMQQLATWMRNMGHVRGERTQSDN